MSSTIPLVTVGAWRNQAVRADAARDTPERRSAAAPNMEVPSIKETRAQENNDCIGGVRSPWKAVRRLPRLAASAAEVRKYLIAQFEKDPSLIDVVGLLGKAVLDGSSEKKWLDIEAQRMGADLAGLLGGSGRSEKGKVVSVWNVGLVEAFVTDANDPEVQLAAWLQDGCPAGVAHGIPHCGIFPTMSPKDRVGSSITEHLQEHEPSSNYASVSEECELSGAEVDRLIEKGYAVKYEEWKDVLVEFGDALVSKLACIIKVREDGTKKVRNVPRPAAQRVQRARQSRGAHRPAEVGRPD